MRYCSIRASTTITINLASHILGGNSIGLVPAGLSGLFPLWDISNTILPGTSIFSKIVH